MRGDTEREATSEEVRQLREENERLKQPLTTFSHSSAVKAAKVMARFTQKEPMCLVADGVSWIAQSLAPPLLAKVAVSLRRILLSVLGADGLGAGFAEGAHRFEPADTPTARALSRKPALAIWGMADQTL